MQSSYLIVLYTSAISNLVYSNSCAVLTVSIVGGSILPSLTVIIKESFFGWSISDYYWKLKVVNSFEITDIGLSKEENNKVLDALIDTEKIKKVILAKLIHNIPAQHWSLLSVNVILLDHSWSYLLLWST